MASLTLPIIHLNHDLCPECGNVSLPRRGCCANQLAVVCVECGAAVELGAPPEPV